MMRLWLAAPALALAACAADDGSTSDEARHQCEAPNADEYPWAFASACAPDVDLNQSTSSAWKFTKTGAQDASAHTITWTIVATPGTTTGHQLEFSGDVEITNRGHRAAPIGNLVFNLQAKTFTGTWGTLASDVVDATHGDAATSAYIAPHASSEHRSAFAENPASGSVDLTDSSGAAVSLAPEITLASGEQRIFHFVAHFDNNVLALKAGRDLRLEVIDSYGSAAPRGHDAANVDINGNGHVDADEAWVGSTSSRTTFKVPAAGPAATTATITDTASDITTTGTASFSNATFSLNATGGTVTVSYDGGNNGGTIKNCAHAALDGTTTVLVACDEQSISATPWHSGDEVTYTQNSWTTAPGSDTLTSNFGGVYTTGSVKVGVKYSMHFTNAGNVLAYIPATGTPAALTGNLVNPTSTPSGSFGGDVLALELNVDFSAKDVFGASSSTALGDLNLCGLTDTSLNGTTVSSLLGTANTLLGGDTTAYSIADIDTLVRDVNSAFDGGTPSAWAQAHLRDGSCP